MSFHFMIVSHWLLILYKKIQFYIFVWSLKCGKRSQSSRGPNTFARHCILNCKHFSIYPMSKCVEFQEISCKTETFLPHCRICTIVKYSLHPWQTVYNCSIFTLKQKFAWGRLWLPVWVWMWLHSPVSHIFFVVPTPIKVAQFKYEL